MADNTVLNAGTGGDTVRDLARQAGSVKTQVVQLDLGGASANAEVLITAGQQVMAASVPVVMASNQSSLPVTVGAGSNTIGAVTGPSAAALALDASLTGHAQTFKAATAGTILSAANTSVTLNIAAAGTGLFTYITRIRITMHNTSATAVAGSAVVLGFTSTNLPNALAWTAGNALAAGSDKVVVDEVLVQPLKTSAANVPTTIVAPACGAGVQVRITAYYYTAA